MAGVQEAKIIAFIASNQFSFYFLELHLIEARKEGYQYPGFGKLRKCDDRSHCVSNNGGMIWASP